MLKTLIVLSSFIIISSCGKGNHQKNLAELDEIYGKCDNPMRANEHGANNKNSRKYRNCKAKEMAGGKSLFDLEESFKDAFGLGGENKSDVLIMSSVNPLLWRASLDVTKDYPLKIADNQGGYIETDWIYGENGSLSTNRCLIKIQILSQELISTGVNTNFICEVKDGNNWSKDENDYIQEEKQITLSVLERASDLAQSNF
tara:strand:+ start:9483 stop:10085 length:603 start_codon:yes stop_codon:yes gene_type:complete